MKKLNNRERPHRGAVAAFCGLAATVVLAVVGSPAAFAASEKPVLSFGVATGPSSLNPAKTGSGSGQSSMVISLSNTAITHLKPDGTIGAGLATSWGYVGSGNKTFSF